MLTICTALAGIDRGAIADLFLREMDRKCPGYPEVLCERVRGDKDFASGQPVSRLNRQVADFPAAIIEIKLLHFTGLPIRGVNMAAN
jgi:hypothetical protein